MRLFGDYTYERLLSGALARVNSALDKREGSLVYNGIAPSMAELAQLYIGLDFVFTATYIATAPREYLIKRAKDRGMEPKKASAAEFRAEFNIEVPVGARFSHEAFNFCVTERMLSEECPLNSFSYRVVCETAGTAPNGCIGNLIPIEYIKGLTSANLVELLISGSDEEDTEEFRQRVTDTLQSQAFGGNRADYKQKVLSINDDIAGVKVYPVWNADTPPSAFIPSDVVQEWFNSGMSGIDDADVKAWIMSLYTAALDRKLTVGGTVHIVIMAAGNLEPEKDLINEVQSAIDP